MHNLFKVIILIIFILFSYSINAHVQHYDNLKRIEFDIYRNDKNIGKHIFSFNKIEEKLFVKSKINFKIIKFGILLYKYSADGTEVFKDGELIKFNSKTDQNGKIKYVNMELDNNQYIIDGSSFKGKASKDFMLGTWWNHEIVKAKAQISAVSGRIIHQKVTFIGKEKVKIGKNIYNALHFNFSSTDKSLSKGKRLNTDVWYDEKSLNWIKASFDKSGKWEYRLISVD